jgi:hypothetical protein
MKKTIGWAFAGALVLAGSLYAYAQGNTISPLLNDLGYAMENIAADITTATTSDRLVVVDVSTTPDDIKYADSANVREIIGTTATAAEMDYLDIAALGTGAASKAVVLDSGDDYTWPAAGVLTYGVLADASTTIGATAAEINAAADVSARYVTIADAAYTVLAVNSGKPHIVANVSADRIFTLPTPAAGLEFEFIADVVAPDGHDWIIDSGSDTNYITGGVLWVIPSGASEAPAPDGSADSKAQITLPDGGTRVKFVSDGTTWNISGVVISATIPLWVNQ